MGLLTQLLREETDVIKEVRKTEDIDKVRAVMRKMIETKYGTISAYAEKAGVSMQFISNVLNGVKVPPDWMCKHFNIKHVVTEHWEIRT